MAIVFDKPRFAIVMHDGSIPQAGLTRSEAYNYAEAYNKAMPEKPCRVVPCTITINLGEVAPC
jgi:hypothetical protein